MNNRIKEAFGDVHAEESLKRGALDAVRRLTHGYRRRVVTRRLAPALACLMIALGGMGGLYFTPTSVISIDVNPSLELSVNRFDRVVGVTSYNEDGRALVQELTLTHQNYAEAVEQVKALRGTEHAPAGRAGRLCGRTEEHLLLCGTA